jgi:hypothetical protein
MAHPQSHDVAVDLLLMVTVVTERVENLREREMRKPPGDLFRRDAEAPVLDDCPNRRPCALDDRFAAEDLVVRDDVAVFCRRSHPCALLSGSLMPSLTTQR